MTYHMGLDATAGCDMMAANRVMCPHWEWAPHASLPDLLYRRGISTPMTWPGSRSKGY